MEHGISTQTPTISFIIPAYKCENTIIPCLEAIISNSKGDERLKFVEIIVVMDGKNDNLKDLLSKFKLSNVEGKFIINKHQIKKSGPAAARNYGAKKASGDFLFFLDSDVILNPNTLHESLVMLDKPGEKIDGKEEVKILQGMFDIMPANPSVSTIFASIKKWVDYNPDKTRKFTTIGSAIFIIKREIFHEFGGFNEGYSSNTVEDYEFGHRVAQKYEIILCPQLTGKHHFPRFGKLIKNYITRTKEWGELYSKSKRFDTGAANKKAALTTGLTGMLLLLLFGLMVFNGIHNLLPSYDLFLSGTILLLVTTILLIILLNLRFLRKFVEIEGIWFAILGFFMLIVLNISIIMGFILLIFSRISKKVDMKNINNTIRILLGLISSVLFSKVNYLILFVTSKCNAKCRFCFNWKEMEGSNETSSVVTSSEVHPSKILQDLTLEEIYAISKNFKNLKYLTISGGEPFLRSDLWKIIHIFIRNADVKIVTIPTNGTLPESIKKQVELIVSNHPEIILNVNLSIDALNEKHDEIRGFKNNFTLLRKSYETLLALKSKYRNLNIQTTTVLSKFNQEEALSTVKWIQNNLIIDNSTISLVRGDPRDITAKNINIRRYIELAKYAKSRLLDFQSKKDYRIVTNLLRLVKAYAWDVIIDVYTNKHNVIECTAGRNMLVIDAQGNLRPCELLADKFGNLRDNEYSVKKILDTQHSRNILNNIKSSKCFCTFECAIQNSIVNNVKGYPMLISFMVKNLIPNKI